MKKIRFLIKPVIFLLLMLSFLVNRSQAQFTQYYIWQIDTNTHDTAFFKQPDSLFTSSMGIKTFAFNLAPLPYHPWPLISGVPNILSFGTVDTLSSSRTFNTSYLSPTTYSEIRPSVQISCSLSLITGQSGVIYLETSADNTTWIIKGSLSGSNTGTLTIGLSTVQVTGGQLYTTLLPNTYWRLRTANVTGSPTYTMQQGNKVISN